MNWFFRVSTKGGLGGGIAYYYYDLGLWKDSDSTIQNYEILKKDVNAFLDSSPALVEYVKSASNSVEKSVSSVTEVILFGYICMQTPSPRCATLMFLW